jgi:hypothetical protein
MKNYITTHGKDCDGYSQDKVYQFSNEIEAQELAESWNEGSDGIWHSAVTKAEAVAYCDENEIEFLFDL